MPQKPPAWTDPNQIGQVPIMISQDVDPTGVPGNNDHAQAEQIVRQNQSVVTRFVKQQRQQIEVGGLDVHSSVLPLQNMDVYYSYVQGLERMHYHISPIAELPQAPPPEEEPPQEQPAVPQLEKPPEPPEPEKPPPVPEPEKPDIPEPPEAPKPEEPPEVPKEEPPERHGTPDFLTIDVPFGLAVVFGDGAGDP